VRPRPDKRKTPHIAERKILEVKILCGMQQICAYLGVSRNTVLRWERYYGFPLRRNPRPALVLSDLDGWGKPGERVPKMVRK